MRLELGRLMVARSERLPRFSILRNSVDPVLSAPLIHLLTRVSWRLRRTYWPHSRHSRMSNARPNTTAKRPMMIGAQRARPLRALAQSSPQRRAHRDRWSSRLSVLRHRGASFTTIKGVGIAYQETSVTSEYESRSRVRVLHDQETGSPVVESVRHASESGRAIPGVAVPRLHREIRERELNRVKD